jgi:AAA+ superfamily predicted ATPase
MILKNYSSAMDNDQNIGALLKEMDWLRCVIDQVIKTYLLQEGHENDWEEIPLPDLMEDDSVYSKCVNEWALNKYQRLALSLAMASHLSPEILDVFFGKNGIYDRGFTEFGGVTDKNHSGFLPTVQTLYFLLSATNSSLRVVANKLLSKENILIREQVLFVGDTEENIPKQNGILVMDHRWFHYFLTGERLEIEHSASFPAQRITTEAEWEDIVLEEHTLQQVQEINTWLQHGDALMNDWGLRKKIKPGYRVLFYGPPGTGKTMTATLLGKTAGREVYRVDLSLIVSKYIGETEKNLSKLFDAAQYKDWILFFDEADSLFSKRTQTQSSNDRHANQLTGYLLQRIEDFPGMTILASNLKANIDEAFLRRFQSVILFDMPSAPERFLLWSNAFSGTCSLHSDIDLYEIAEAYELSGGAIINVLRYCAMCAISRKDRVVRNEDLLAGIEKEYRKENRTLKFLK